MFLFVLYLPIIIRLSTLMKNNKDIMFYKINLKLKGSVPLCRRSAMLDPYLYEELKQLTDINICQLLEYLKRSACFKKLGNPYFTLVLELNLLKMLPT